MLMVKNKAYQKKTHTHNWYGKGAESIFVVVLNGMWQKEQEIVIITQQGWNAFNVFGI